MRKSTQLASVVITALLAVTGGSFAISSAIAAATVNDSEVSLYPFYFGQLQPPATQFEYDQDILANPSKSDYGQTWSCPSSSTDAAIYLSARGDERTKLAWKAWKFIGFVDGKDNQLTNIRPAGLTNGIAQTIKSLGGDYSLGVACTSSFGSKVEKTGYLYISITAGTGIWTAQAPPEVNNGTPSPTPSPTSTPTVSPTPTVTPSPSVTPTPTATPAAFTAALIPAATPSWLTGATIYQVNVRSFSKRGDFAGFSEQIPRLKKLGIKVVNFLPVTPISETDKIGLKGNVDATDSFTAINPDLGLATDFTNLVSQLHYNKIKVIVSWQAAGVGLDNPWIVSNPEFFLRDGSGQTLNPSQMDRPDLAAFDFSSVAMQLEQIKAMRTCITKFGIDGILALDAKAVPASFWQHAVAEIGNNANFAWIADTQKPTLATKSFSLLPNDAFFTNLSLLPTGKATGSSLLAASQAAGSEPFTSTSTLNFTSNEYQNTRGGNAAQKFGAAMNEALVLQFFTPGVPLLYMGQEVASTVRVPLGSQKPISDWSSSNKTTSLVAKLIDMRIRNPAFGETKASGLSSVATNNKGVSAFVRSASTGDAMVIFNTTSKAQTASLKPRFTGTRTDLVTGKSVKLAKSYKVSLPAFGFQILTKSN
jgi:hypothetical protein